MIMKIDTTYMFRISDEKSLAKEFESTHNMKDWVRTSNEDYIVYTNKIYYDNLIDKYGGVN